MWRWGVKSITKTILIVNLIAACDRGFWGTDCKKPCDCPDGYTCHHLTGDCMIDDKPALTTKYRRTTTTTAATVSPETAITQSTTRPTTPEPPTETTTQTFSATKEIKTIPTLQSQSATLSTLPSTTETSVTTVITSEPTVQTKMFTTTTDQSNTFHFINETQATQMTSGKSSTTSHTSTTLGPSSSTYIVVVSANLPPSTIATTSETTTELPLQQKIPPVITTKATEDNLPQNTPTPTSSTTDLFVRKHSVIVDDFSEAYLSTSPAMFTTSSSAVTATTSIPFTTSSELPPSIVVTTSTASPTLSSTISTTSSKPSSPISLLTMEDTSIESTTAKLFKSTSKISTKSLPGSETTTTALLNLPVITDTFSSSTTNTTSFKSSTLSEEDVENKSTVIKDSVPTSGSTTQTDNYNNVPKNINFDVSIVETSPTIITSTTDATKVTKIISSSSVPSTRPPLHIINHEQHLEVSTISASETSVFRDLTATREPSAILKKDSDEENTFYDVTTDSMNLGEIEEKNEEINENIVNTPNADFATKTDTMSSTSTAYLETDPNSTAPTIYKHEIVNKSTESPKTTALETLDFQTSKEDNSQIAAITKEKSEDLFIVTTEKNFIVSTNDRTPLLEVTEIEKLGQIHKLGNNMNESYKNSTNLISGINEISTNFGQPILELGKSVSETKLKQRTEATTTSSTKVDSNSKNLMITTNARPAHTWYTHVKEFQKKIKNKEDLKLANLESLVVTERDMSEESNIIDSMHTTYIEKGYKGNSGPPPIVNEEANMPSTYLHPGQINYNLSGVLAEGVQAGRNDKSFFSLYTTSTLILGLALILLVSTSATLWLCHRRRKEPTTLRGPCIMAYGSPSEFTLNPLMYETVYPLEGKSIFIL